MAQSGFPGFDASFSLVLYAIDDTPTVIVDGMSKALDSVLQRADVVERQRLAGQGVASSRPVKP
ncbi:MAG: hypothetical protein RL375_2019 [Pseudomonadota bacterium]